MYKIYPCYDASSVKRYFDSGLQRENYLSKGEEMPGIWGGSIAHNLGLQGEVKREDFHALCDNTNPQNGEPITPHKKSNRKVAFDLNFGAKKSVSILYAYTKDSAILDAFNKAVDDTLRDIESDMHTRVRKNGANTDRQTGSMIYAKYVHLKSRPVKGVEDPHIHTHAIAFNITMDKTENRYKAAQLFQMHKEAPFFQAVFHSRLAANIKDLGYGINQKGKSWEVAGLSKELVTKFSQRTEMINQIAKEKGITNDKQKDVLGSKYRESKNEGASFNEWQQSDFLSRLTDQERSQLQHVVSQDSAQPQKSIAPLSLDKTLKQTSDHLFERNAVVPTKTLAREVLAKSWGSYSPEEVFRAIEQQKENGRLIERKVQGRQYVTTKEMADMESNIIKFAAHGRGTCKPVLSKEKAIHPNGDSLSQEQRDAVNHIFTF